MIIWGRKATGPNQRKVPRRNVRYPARIDAIDGSALPCMLVDISQTDARLLATGTDQIPGEFTLLLGSAVRTCRVVWRNERQLGVQFLPPE
jgi:PilZ domain